MMSQMEYVAQAKEDLPKLRPHLQIRATRRMSDPSQRSVPDHAAAHPPARVVKIESPRQERTPGEDLHASYRTRRATS